MKRSWQILALLMVLLLVVTSCSPAPTGDDPAPADPAETEDPADEEEPEEPAEPADEEEELIIAQGADAVSLDPHGQNDQSSSRVRVQMFDTLLMQDKNMEFQPLLATSWEQIDDLTVEFKLREGVKFHNGEDFGAKDVIYSIQRAIASPQAGHIVDMIDGDKLEEVDNLTVRVVTKEPFGPLLAHLSHPAAAITNEKAVTDAGDDIDITPVGTGPYKLKEWARGDYIILERNDDYWGEPAKTKTIRFRAVSENANRTIELETGGVHIAYDILPNDISKVEDNPDLQLFRDKNFSTTYVGFNAQKEPFDNKLVRQAINHAVNMDEIVEAVYYGTGNKASGPLGANVTFANTELAPYEYNPELAKEMLAEAGAEDISLVIWTNDNKIRMDIAEIMQNQLQAVGINATSEVVEWGAYLSQTAAGEHDMFILGWTTVTGDADYGLYALFHSSQFGDAGNRTFYKNERVDELLDIGRTATSVEDREAAYKEAQEIIREDAPWIFTWNGEDLTGASNRVSGFELHPAGHYRLHNVSLGN